MLLKKARSGLVTESDDAYINDDDIYVWEFIEKNEKLIGIPITEEKSLDLLGALRAIKIAIEKSNLEEAGIMLDSVATALVAAAQGIGNKIVEEIIVAEAMEELDSNLKGILDEGQ